MSSKNGNAKHSKREEQQGNKVVKIVFISLLILGLALVLAVSFFG